jgi:L-threonylcarbamoyladenylate synthase
MTRLVRIDADPLALTPPEAVDSLRKGGMVICPTDTLYALAVDPLSWPAVSRLVAAKSRDRGKPIPLLLSGTDAAGRWARRIPKGAARLMRRFWPGALTIVLPAVPGLHPAITGGGDTVGLRVPAHPVPRTLAEGVSGAITGTSANRGGEPGAWETPEEIVREFSGEVEWVLWDGKAGRRAPAEGGRKAPQGSTVVRMTDGRPELLREGIVPFRDIMEFLDEG